MYNYQRRNRKRARVRLPRPNMTDKNCTKLLNVSRFCFPLFQGKFLILYLITLNMTLIVAIMFIVILDMLTMELLATSGDKWGYFWLAVALFAGMALILRELFKTETITYIVLLWFALSIGTLLLIGRVLYGKPFHKTDLLSGVLIISALFSLYIGHETGHTGWM